MFFKANYSSYDLFNHERNETDEIELHSFET